MWQTELRVNSTTFPPRCTPATFLETIDMRILVTELELTLGKSAEKQLLPLQAGDVLDTYADVFDLAKQLYYQPATLVEEGILQFVAWYRHYYKVQS